MFDIVAPAPNSLVPSLSYACPAMLLRGAQGRSPNTIIKEQCSKYTLEQ